MNNKIYPVDLNDLHPYKQTDEVDTFYAKIATQIYQILKSSNINEVIRNDASIRYTAIALTGYFEDIISETGIWQSFTETCRKRYGRYVPFFDTNEEYYTDEINPEDVCFLLWYHAQSFCEDGTLLNPENEALHYIAAAIYATFDNAFEEAPINTRLQEFLAKPILPNDFDGYRERLDWFEHNYLQVESSLELGGIMEEIFGNPDIPHQYKNTYVYDAAVRHFINSRTNLLSISNHEWLALVQKNHPQHELFDKVTDLEYSYYLAVKEEDGFAYFEDLKAPERGMLKVAKKSMEIPKGFPLNGKTVLRCGLTYFGNCYWQCGLLSPTLYDEKTKEEINHQIEEEKNMKDNNQINFRNFMSATGNKFFVFLKDLQATVDFFDQQLHCSFQKDKNVADLEGSIMLTATPTYGITFHNGCTENIKSPDNPFYDPKSDGEKALPLITNPNIINYQSSCILQDKGMLADARMKNEKNPEAGHKLVQENMDFLRDFVFHKCREKDFDNDAELQKYLKE